TDAPGRDLLERMGRRGEQEWMAHDRTRGGRIESQPAGSRCSQSERHVNVAAAMRMIVHAHAVEARILATGDEVGHAGYGGPYWNAKVDLHVMSLHSHTSLILSGFSCAQRPSSAAAAALRNRELSRTRIAAAVCCSDWFGDAHATLGCSRIM